MKIVRRSRKKEHVCWSSRPPFSYPMQLRRAKRKTQQTMKSFCFSWRKEKRGHGNLLIHSMKVSCMWLHHNWLRYYICVQCSWRTRKRKQKSSSFGYLHLLSLSFLLFVLLFFLFAAMKIERCQSCRLLHSLCRLLSFSHSFFQRR